ncbi:MAG TPA: hypothetical protein VF635_00985 [Propionibacteriaceae bacterium]|jgi:hypothetical protein
MSDPSGWSAWLTAHPSATAVLMVSAMFAAFCTWQLIGGLRHVGTRALGPGLRLVGVWTLLGAQAAGWMLLFFWLMERLPDFVALLIYAAVAIPIGLPIASALTRLLFKVRRGMVADAARAMSRDPRPPILYLRGFEDDAREGVTPDSGGFVLGTLEERLVRALRAHGPVIAVGHPSEPLPPLGAARLYVADDQWQATVLDLAERSQLVVLRPATSAGLRWEIQEVIPRVGAERFSVYTRDLDPPTWSLFVEEVGDALGARLPHSLPPDAVLLYTRRGKARTIAWNPGPGDEGGQYFLRGKALAPLFDSL